MSARTTGERQQAWGLATERESGFAPAREGSSSRHDTYSTALHSLSMSTEPARAAGSGRLCPETCPLPLPLLSLSLSLSLCA